MSWTDTWVHSDTGSKVEGSMASYYVCEGTAFGTCLTALDSKDWALEARNKQFRWYCPRCQCRFRAQWGQLVVITRTNMDSGAVEYFYMRAEVPPWTMQDGRALFHRYHKEKGENTSYEEYERLLIGQPTSDDYFVEDDEDDETHEDGSPVQYKRIVSKECFDSIPIWTWEQIYNFVGKTPPPRKARRTAEPEETSEVHGVRGMCGASTTAQASSSGHVEPETV